MRQLRHEEAQFAHCVADGSPCTAELWLPVAISAILLASSYVLEYYITKLLASL